MANDFINSMFFLCSILIWFRFSLDLMLRSCSNRSRDHHLAQQVRERAIMKKNAIENSFLEKSNIYIEIDRTEEGIIFQHPLRI